MSPAEREPELDPDEARELSQYAGHEARPGPVDRTRPDASVEPRPPIVSSLGLWWVPVLGLLVACGFLVTDHMLRAGASFGASMWLAAGLRAFLPESAAGGLVVRNRWLDVAMLVIGGIAVVVSAFTLDLTDLRR
ncbi:MAG: DUF3017 domain-containing protein [Actinomycetia bacterium]|nr:DUF3017 domain-containing protein [Actinomycetes bacterium]